jgi:Arc/MetJ-type ribon-helix-helix transcriptional regulator
LGSSIRQEVLNGHFASEDDLVAAAVRDYLQRRQQQAPQQQPAPEAHKPIWEVVEELRKNVPPEEFSKLPRDGAEQLDHYIYGSPKRPAS